MGYKFIFGPVSSRRFGSSLGIDLSPDQKSCNFDCLYCELKKAKTIRAIKNEPNSKGLCSSFHLEVSFPTNCVSFFKCQFEYYIFIFIIFACGEGSPLSYSPLHPQYLALCLACGRCLETCWIKEQVTSRMPAVCCMQCQVLQLQLNMRWISPKLTVQEGQNITALGGKYYDWENREFWISEKAS